MTDKEKYDFIDHVVHLTLLEEDRLLNEHGGDFSGLEEDGIDSNEYYRIITERVINTLKKNNNYMQEEPVNIWHDANEEPKPNMELICVGQYSNPLVLSSNSDSFKSRYISKWAYFNDLINLSNVQTTVKDWKKEPVSKDLEKYAALVADEAPQGTRLTKHGEFDIEVVKELIKYSVRAGAKWDAEQGYKISERVYNYNFNGENKPFLNPVIFLPDDFKIGDKVMVQIRKKEE